MSGRCVCKPGVLGIKCDECPSGRILTVYGCTDESIFRSLPKSCSQMVCLFGARCREMKTSVPLKGHHSSSLDDGNSVQSNQQFDETASSSSSSSTVNSQDVNVTSQSIITTRAQCICDGLCEMPLSPSFLHASSSSSSSSPPSSSLERSSVPSLTSHITPSMSHQLKSHLSHDEPLVSQTTAQSTVTDHHQLHHQQVTHFHIESVESSLAQSLPAPLYKWLYKHVHSLYTDDRTKREIRGEVCGSNGITYANECELRMHSCRIQESIIVLSKGPCKSEL